MFYVYLLHSLKKAKTYIGSTVDLRKRLAEHNAGLSFSTKQDRPWTLVYYEAFAKLGLARAREHNLKHNGNAVRELKKRIGLGKKVVRGERGFSTLEILIAMVILVSSFTAVLLLTSAESLSSDAQVSAEALTSARQALENEQSLARKDFKLVVATSSPSGIAGIQSTTTIAVTQTDLFTKKVTATVSWKGTYNRLQNISLSTLITNFNNAVSGDTCSSVLTGNWKSPVVANATFGTVVGDTAANPPYPITAVDAFQGRLYATVSTSSSPVGPRDPSSGADSNAVGTITWSNPSRVTAKDGSTASLNTSGTNVSHYLKATNFGFTIPPGATILGIKADIYRSASGQSGSNSVVDSQVKIVRADGTIGATNKASGTLWPTSQTAASYGTATDLWNENNWTPANINNANFGVVLAVAGNNSGANRIANVDSIQVTVYYTKQFYIFSLSNPGSPVFLGGLATSTLTTGMNALVVATTSTAHYAYIGTNSSSGLNQLQIIDVTNPAVPFVRGTFPSVAGTGMGSGIANGIFYKDGYAYIALSHVGSGPEFNIVDVSTPATPVWKGGYTFGTTTNSVTVKDGYAYVTTNDSAKELLVLNVTNPSNPTLVGTYDATPDVTGFGYGRGLYTVGDNVYLGRSWTNSSSIPQFLTLDASTTPIKSVNSKTLGTNFSLRSIIVRDYLAFLLTGSTSVGGNLQIISATSTLAWGGGTVALPTGATGQGGVSMDCEGNYIYAASVDNLNKGYISAITGQ